MTIPESQLERWAKPGPSAQSQRAHASIRGALRAFDGWPDGATYDVYLQGSYRNSTNIRADSDVDVVVQLNSSWRYDHSRLSPLDRRAFDSDFHPATYEFDGFRADVLRALRDHYGYFRVKEGNKSLKVETSYLPGDVVPCLQYRRYQRFASHDDQAFVEGMTFQASGEWRWIVNYPKVHYLNGVAKNRESGEWFKPTVRMFKNARKHLVDRYRLQKKAAPSYFVESLIYNAPNRCFGPTHQNTFDRVVKWMQSVDLGGLLAQHKQGFLFGPRSEQWNKDDAKEFGASMAQLWEKDGASILYGL